MLALLASAAAAGELQRKQQESSRTHKMWTYLHSRCSTRLQRWHHRKVLTDRTCWVSPAQDSDMSAMSSSGVIPAKVTLINFRLINDSKIKKSSLFLQREDLKIQTGQDGSRVVMCWVSGSSVNTMNRLRETEKSQRMFHRDKRDSKLQLTDGRCTIWCLHDKNQNQQNRLQNSDQTLSV